MCFVNIITQKNQQDAICAATGQLQELLVQYADTPVLLLLSGGSALRILEGIIFAQRMPDLVVTMLDERVSTDPDVSNFAQLTKTNFYETARAQGAHFIDTRPAEREDVNTLATRLNAMLAAVLSGYAGQDKDLVIIATMGVGTDGHIAGIMPYPDDASLFTQTFIDTKKCFVGYDAGTKNQFPLRITATVAFLTDKVDYVVAVVVGEDKGEALTNMSADKGALHDAPARVIHNMKNGTIFTDI